MTSCKDTLYMKIVVICEIYNYSILLYYEAKEGVHTSVAPPPRASTPPLPAPAPAPRKYRTAPRPSRYRAHHPPAETTRDASSTCASSTPRPLPHPPPPRPCSGTVESSVAPNQTYPLPRCAVASTPISLPGTACL
jgi:hypothetical protein